MSTTVTAAPASSASVSSSSSRGAAAPWGAAQSTASLSSAPICHGRSLRSVKARPGKHPARCGKAASTSPPAWLSETTASVERCGWPAEEPQQLAGHVARAAQDDRWTRSLIHGATTSARTPSPSFSRTSAASFSPSVRRVEGRHAHGLLDDPRPRQVVRGRAGHRHRLDAEPVAEHLHPAPGRHRIVGGQHHRGERGADLRVLQDGRHTVGPQQAVPKLGHDERPASPRPGG